MTKKIIEVKNISKIFHSLKNQTHAIDNISFDVFDKEFLTIVGPSGCGKSTILSILAGIISPSFGEVFIKDAVLKGYSSCIGYMLQQDHLLEWRTVEKNVMLGIEIRKNLNENTRNYALELVKKYGLNDFLNHYPNQISGGMKQKVALIRSLALKPEILLLDEPFSALDFQSRIEIADEIKAIIKKEGKTAILITHDLFEAVSLSDRIIVISNRPGKIKKVQNISISGNTSIEKRKDKNFNEYVENLWKEIDKNE